MTESQGVSSLQILKNLKLYSKFEKRRIIQRFLDELQELENKLAPKFSVKQINISETTNTTTPDLENSLLLSIKEPEVLPKGGTKKRYLRQLQKVPLRMSILTLIDYPVPYI